MSNPFKCLLAAIDDFFDIVDTAMPRPAEERRVTKRDRRVRDVPVPVERRVGPPDRRKGN